MNGRSVCVGEPGSACVDTWRLEGCAPSLPIIQARQRRHEIARPKSSDCIPPCGSKVGADGALPSML